MSTFGAAVLAMTTFLLGSVLGADIRGSAEDQFQRMSPQARSDFIYAMASPAIRRAIAEDWCAINRKTRGICGRARIVTPVKR